MQKISKKFQNKCQTNSKSKRSQKFTSFKKSQQNVCFSILGLQAILQYREQVFDLGTNSMLTVFTNDIEN